MTTQNVPAFQIEDHMPPPNELKFRVDFIYHDEIPDRILDKYWDSDSEKNKVIKSKVFVGKRKAMEQAVAQIVSPNDSPDDKLRKIYARTQKIRNLSYEVGRSEQEVKRDKQKEIKDVEELWKEGYGWGSDITWLFLGLAEQRDFEAYPSWCPIEGIFLLKQRMNGRELNANVVLVKLNGKRCISIRGRVLHPSGFCLGWRPGREASSLIRMAAVGYKRRFPTATSRISNEVPI